MSKNKPARKLPVGLVVLDALAWGLWLYFQYVALLALAIAFLVFVGLRLMRRPREITTKRILRELNHELGPPSRHVAKVLLPNEKLLLCSHQHPINLLLWEIGFSVWTAGAIALGLSVNPTTALTLGVAGFLAFGFKVFVWRHDMILLTNKRIIGIVGFVNQKVGFLSFSKITDQLMVEPWHSRLLRGLGIIGVDYGTLTLRTAGEKQAIDRTLWVPRVNELNLFIMYMALGDEKPGG